MLHSLFNKQCFLIKNNSNIQLTIFLKTDISLSNVTFNEQGIENILLNVNPNKAHEHVMINIRLLQICGKSINKPLEIIYKSSSEKVCFSSEWEKTNVIPVKKKVTKNCLKITVQYHYCLLLLKLFYKDYSITQILKFPL